MSAILYEPSSLRLDHGILQLMADEPCNIPFVFEIKDSLGNDYIIGETDIVEFTIKSNTNLISNIINKRFNKIKNNVAVLSLTYDDMKLLKSKKTYYLSAKLCDMSLRVKKVLISNLQTNIQGVV